MLNHEPVVIYPKGSINRNLIQAVGDNPANHLSFEIKVLEAFRD